MLVRDAILNTLEHNPLLILDVASEFPETQRRERLIPGKWSALEHLAHLARVEEMMVRRLEGLLKTPDRPVTAYDPDQDSPHTLADHDWDAVGTLYRMSRGALVTRLQAVDEETWHRPVVHPEYPRYSIHIMCRHLALHDGLHGYRIEELLSRLTDH